MHKDLLSFYFTGWKIDSFCLENTVIIQFNNGYQWKNSTHELFFFSGSLMRKSIHNKVIIHSKIFHKNIYDMTNLRYLI